MPVNYPRTEIHFSIAVSVKLSQLRQEIYEKTGKKISKSRLVEQIVDMFFERSELSQLAISKNQK